MIDGNLLHIHADSSSYPSSHAYECSASNDFGSISKSIVFTVPASSEDINLLVPELFHTILNNFSTFVLGTLGTNGSNNIHAILFGHLIKQRHLYE